MSHTTEIKDIVFSDIEALKAAVRDLGKAGVKCSLKENVKPRMYYKDQLPVAPYVLALENASYDVGFYKEDGKNYVAKTDFYGGSVASQLGATPAKGESADQARLGKLYQYYAVNAAARQAARQGYSVRRVTKADGTIQLIMTQ